MTKNSMSPRDAKLEGLLHSRIRHFDGPEVSFGKKHYSRSNADDAGIVVGQPNPTNLAALKGNPPFIGQFNNDISIRYFSVAGGVYTLRTAAYLLANAPTLATKLGLFVFAQTDFQAGYKNSKSVFPQTLWVYGVPFVYGKDYPITTAGVLDATATAQLMDGDLVIPSVATVGGVTYVALVIQRIAEVATGTLIASLNSDMFGINNLRYTLNQTTGVLVNQYRNILYALTQSFLGTFNRNQIPVNAMKQPEQFQNGIIDIPIEKDVDKNIGFGTYINYDQEDNVSLGFFLASINKLAA